MADSTQAIRYGRGQFEQHEAPADGTVQVGHLLERTANGVSTHSTDGGDIDAVMVAIGARGRGMELGDTYADGENVHYVTANAGTGIHLVLAAGTDLVTAANATIAENDRLVSAGDGTVRGYDADTADAVVGLAAEAIDNSGAAAGATADLASEVTR